MITIYVFVWIFKIKTRKEVGVTILPEKEI